MIERAQPAASAPREEPVEAEESAGAVAFSEPAEAAEAPPAGASIPAASGRATAAVVWALLRGRRALLLGIVCAGLLAAGAAMLGPYVVGRLVDVLSAQPSMRPVALGAVVIGVAAVVAGVGAWLSERWLGRLAEPAVSELRCRVFDAAVQADTARIERSGRGDLVSRVTSDADRVSESASEVLPLFLQAGLTIVVAGTGLVAVDWRLALIGLIALPLYALTVRWYLPRSAPLYRREREAFGVRAQRMLGALTGVETLRAYAAERGELRRIDAASGRARDLSIGVFRLLTLAAARNNRAEAITLAALLGGGFAFVAAGWTTAGAVSTAALIFHRLFDPISVVVDLFDEVQSAGASLTRMVGVIEVGGEAPTAEVGGSAAAVRAGSTRVGRGLASGQGRSATGDDGGRSADARAAQGQGTVGPGAVRPEAMGSGAAGSGAVATGEPCALVLTDVTVDYGGAHPAVDAVSLRVAAGEVVAIVGPAGRARRRSPRPRSARSSPPAARSHSNSPPTRSAPPSPPCLCPSPRRCSCRCGRCPPPRCAAASRW